MRKLSDYEGDAAIELWGNLLGPVSDILSDKQVAEAVRADKSQLEIVQTILKRKKKAAERLLLCIDPTPLNGLNVITRLLTLVADVASNPELAPFFGYAVRGETESASSGSAMESIEEGEQ